MDKGEALKQLKFQLQRAKNQMTYYANRYRKMTLIQSGDLGISED